MSETLVGVVIGGLIASIGPLLSLMFQHNQWKAEQKLQHLQAKRAQLETLFERALRAFDEGLDKDSYSVDFWSELDMLHPKSVADAMEAMLHDEEKTIENYRMHYYAVHRAMKAELAAIDGDIEKLVS